jgi:hypothetical protein
MILDDCACEQYSTADNHVCNCILFTSDFTARILFTSDFTARSGMITTPEHVTAAQAFFILVS